MDDKLGRMVAHRREAEAARRSDAARRRLQEAAATRVRTAMIGAISVLEEVFGDLWGQGLPPGSLTDTERAMDRRREEARTRILNLGNGQIRGLRAEIDRYEVSWDGYHYDLNMRKDDDVEGV